MAASYTTYATVTGDSDGSEVSLNWGVLAYNGSSGADRNFNVRVQCDGATVREWTGLFIELDNNRRYTFGGLFNHTPAAGNHTWTYQMYASNASSVVFDDPYLEVRRTA